MVSVWDLKASIKMSSYGKFQKMVMSPYKNLMEIIILNPCKLDFLGRKTSWKVERVINYKVYAIESIGKCLGAR